MNSSENIRIAMVRWLDYHPSATLSLVDLSIAMEKSVKRHGAVLAPFYHEMASHIEAQDKLLASLRKELKDAADDIDIEAKHASRHGRMDSLEEIAASMRAALSQKDTP